MRCWSLQRAIIFYSLFVNVCHQPWAVSPDLVGGRLQKFLPACVGRGFSNLPIVVYDKNNKIDP